MRRARVLVAPNIYRLPNGKFMVDKSFGSGKELKRIRRVTRSMREARIVLKDMVAKAQLNQLDLSGSLRLGELMEMTWPLKKDLANAKEIARYRGEIREFFGQTFLVEKINKLAINRFKAKLKGQKKRSRGSGTLSNRSIDHRLAELRWLLRFAAEEGMIDRAPRVQLIGHYGWRHLAIKLEDFNRVIPFLPEPPFPHRAMLLMALNTGMRWADLANMRWSQIQGDRVHFRSSKTQKEGLMVPLMARVQDALAMLPIYDHTDVIFVNPATGKPYNNIRKSLARAIQIAEIPPFTMHSIRHLATTLLLEETKDRDLVQRVMGWSDQAMVKRYGHVSDRAEKAFTSLNARLESQLDDTMTTPKNTIENESR